MARILILTPQLPVPPQSLTGAVQGTTIRNFNLIAGLARQHTVDLLSFRASEGGGALQGEDESQAILRRYCRQVITEPAPVRTLRQRAQDTLTTTLPDMALRLVSDAMQQRLSALLAADGSAYAVIQVEGIEMAPYGLAALQWREARAAAGASQRPFLVFDDHNAEYVLQQRAFLTDMRRPARWVAAAYSFLQWQKLARYERTFCRAADRVAAVSDVDRAALLRLAPEIDVAVVPNGVDLAFYRPGVVPSQPELGPGALVFTGKMDYRPNVDAVRWFADAVLPLIRADEPDAHFYIVGQKPHPKVQALAERPGITVTGRVPDTRPYIAGAGVCVVPLRIGGGTRLKVLEAMAMGQAIVSTQLGCDGFQFVDGREVRFADEPADFAAATVALLRDRALGAALGQAARAHVEAHFGWEAIVPKLEALYR